MVYKWRSGERYSLPADVAGQELQKIRERNGVIEPEAVVQAARRKTSPLHPVFEWDDAKAAHQHRLNQARHMIRAIVIESVDGAETESEVRAFVHLESAGGYEDTLVALRDDESRAEVLNRARVEMERWVKRYGDLEEFAVVVAAWRSAA